MDSPKPSGKLVNKNTRFSRFKWVEDPKIRAVIQEIKEKLKTK